MSRSVLFQIAAGSAILSGLVAFVPANAAEPLAKADVTDKTLYLAPNAALRYGDSLLSRTYSRTNAYLQLKGRGVCDQFNCPVSHNGISLVARRARLDTDRPVTGTVVTERTVRYKDDGPDVKILQEKLIAKGYRDVKADGTFGRETEDAVKDFQRKNNLKADGEIGAETRNKLAV